MEKNGFNIPQGRRGNLRPTVAEKQFTDEQLRMSEEKTQTFGEEPKVPLWIYGIVALVVAFIAVVVVAAFKH